MTLNKYCIIALLLPYFIKNYKKLGLEDISEYKKI